LLLQTGGRSLESFAADNASWDGMMEELSREDVIAREVFFFSLLRFAAGSSERESERAASCEGSSVYLLYS
jgi:hypothetical protein